MIRLGNKTSTENFLLTGIDKDFLRFDGRLYWLDHKKILEVIYATPDFQAYYLIMYDSVSGFWDDPVPKKVIGELRESIKNGSW